MNAEDALKEGEAAYIADDYPRAAALLLPLAEAGHPHAQYLAAEMYRGGHGVAQDAAASVRFFKAAADQGHARAAMFLSFHLDPVMKNAPPMDAIAKDSAEAGRYLDLSVARNLELAGAGDLQAMADLGFLYHLGIGVKRDGAEAIRWYTRAFEAGGTGAALGRGDVYRDGEKCIRDAAKAKFWHAKYMELCRR
ncbi:MAG TPA: tetratricopeptide repeat protein [Tepidisphaeraceae bacterium]|jgi:hypothetical protein